MKPEELLNLIKSDSIATALIEKADDFMCAERCSLIAPKIRKELFISRLGILELYSHNPMLGISVLNKIDNAAINNPIVKEIVSFMKPESFSLPDFSLNSIRNALIAPLDMGGVGLTYEEAFPILEAGVQSQEIKPIEVEYVRIQLWHS